MAKKKNGKYAYRMAQRTAANAEEKEKRLMEERKAACQKEIEDLRQKVRNQVFPLLKEEMKDFGKLDAEGHSIGLSISSAIIDGIDILIWSYGDIIFSIFPNRDWIECGATDDYTIHQFNANMRWNFMEVSPATIRGEEEEKRDSSRNYTKDLTGWTHENCSGWYD